MKLLRRIVPMSMPLPLRVYVYIIIALGMITFIYFSKNVDVSLIPYISIIGLIAALLERYPVELPNGTVFSVATSFTFVTLIFYGIPEAIVVEFVIGLVSLPIYRTQLVKAFYNMSQYIICLVIAGYFYFWIGGSLNNFAFKDIPLLIIFVIAYNIMNALLLSIILSTLFKSNYYITWLNILKDSAYILILTTILSLRLAFAYDSNDQFQFWVESIFIFVIFLILRYAFNLFINLRKTYLTSMESLTNHTEIKLSISEGHSTRVGQIARTIAEELKLSQAEIDTIHYAALFHDVGKVQLNEHMFRKRGPLTLEEEKEYQNHVHMGADMVKEISGLDKTAEYVRYHHEQWDGLGFPSGKKGEEIPLGARIIAAANQYDHIINDEKIKKPAIEFKKLAHSKLDPQLVKILVPLVDFKKPLEHSSKEAVIEEKLIEKIVMSTTKSKFYESQLLKKFGTSLIVTYDHRFRDEEGKVITVPCESEVLSLVEKARSKQQRIREFIEDTVTGKVYDIYCVPFDKQVKIMFFDVSHILDYEKKQEERVRFLYRDVIYSVTQGKLLLAESEEINSFYQSVLLAEAPIITKQDVAQCREKVQKVLEDISIPEKLKFNLLLCTSEVATNVLKHATEGVMKIYQHEKSLRIIVKDDGSGIELSDIPKSTLQAGYSSKTSMGQGFSLLLELMDRVVISTGTKGTTIVLELEIGS